MPHTSVLFRMHRTYQRPWEFVNRRGGKKTVDYRKPRAVTRLDSGFRRVHNEQTCAERVAL